VAYTSEIEKLEKRWLENPKGRNFAPLADAYRKAGEVDRAIDLCKAGLERHPDYVSAHIVFARCLIDQKNDAGASDVFRKVLALDPEMMLLDEPMAGLGQEDIKRIAALIRTVARDRTVLMVEHNMSVVADLSDTITVLARGEVLAEGPYATVSKDPAVVEAYVGTGHG